MQTWLTSALGHLFYAFECTAFVMRNILYLRLFAIAASLIAIVYFALQPEKLWIQIFWQSIYALINTTQVGILLAEQRPQAFKNDDEEYLYQHVFQELSPRSFQALISLADRKDYRNGETLFRQGTHIDHIYIVIRGSASIMFNDHTVAEYHRGALFGDLSFASGIAATSTVKAAGDLHCLSWSYQTFRNFFAGITDGEKILHNILGMNLVKKIKLLK